MERDTLVFYLKLAAGALAALWGGLPVLVQVLIGLMALDIATGMLAAFIAQELSSDVSFRGMARKAIVLLVVAGGVWLEPAVGLPVGQAVAGFYAAHEGLSLIENVARAGLPVPQVLRDALAKLSPEQEPPPQRDGSHG
ncbi:MAG: phage holin family protein [Chloroflexi bacterium]|nr:phage holin family protein [Chloroflexota bacterium]